MDNEQNKAHNRNIPDTLPNKLSELAKVAVNDFRKLLKRKPKGVRIEMGNWMYKPTKKAACHVCMAGSMLRGTCRVKPVWGDGYDAIATVSDPIRYKAFAVNEFRVGNLVSALRWLERAATGIYALAEPNEAVDRAANLITRAYTRQSTGKKRNDSRYTGRAPLRVYDQAIKILAEAGL